MGAGFSTRIRAAANEADVYIYEDVGSSWFGGVSALDFAEALRALGSVKTINVRINSYGGDVFDGLAIYRQLVDHSAKIVTHIDGVAASIASVIAMAGNEIRVAEAGFVMIHNAWGVGIGEAKDMRQMADTLDACTGSVTDVYAARTKNTPATLKAWMDAETWFNGKDAVANGFATELAENLRVAAFAGEGPQARLDLPKHNFRKPPAALATPAAASAPATARPQFDAARQKIDRMRAHANLRRAETLRA
jgi:ATP-dependent Clp protease protease subunit